MIITEGTKEGRNKQLIEFIKHPLIQRKCTLVAVLGISHQRLDSLIKGGLKQVAVDMINGNNELIETAKKTYDKKDWLKERAAQRRVAKSFTRKMNMKQLSDLTGVSYHSLAMSRSRGKVALSIARVIADKTEIDISDIRPDIPPLAVKYGIKRWCDKAGNY